MFEITAYTIGKGNSLFLFVDKSTSSTILVKGDDEPSAIKNWIENMNVEKDEEYYFHEQIGYDINITKIGEYE